jgi:hypothetical protein
MKKNITGITIFSLVLATVLVGFKTTHAGTGEPTVFDNISALGGIKAGVQPGDLSIPSYGNGSIFATGAIVSSSSITGSALNLGSLNGPLYGNNGSILALAGTSTVIWIDSNRTDTYTANGSNLLPYKSLSAAITAINSSTYAAATLFIAPGTYIENNPTFPNIPLVVYGNGATIILGNGTGNGTLTIPNDISFYDAVIIGNVNETDSSLTNPHTFTNAFIEGSVTLQGNATLINGATVDRTAPFVAASSTLTAATSSLVNVVGENIQNVIVNKGTMNIDDDNLIVSTSTTYAITSSGINASVQIVGLSLTNLGTGGGINLTGSSTSSPSVITDMGMVLGAGTTNALVAGGAFTKTALYNATTLAGVTLYATGTNLSAFDSSLTSTDATSTFATQSSNVGIGTSTPDVLFQVANQGTNATTTVKFGKVGQTKGTCLSLFDAAGNAVYAYIASGATAWTVTATSCK